MEIDLFTPEFQRDPYPSYARLREREPIYREPRFGNYVLTRFADVHAALRDHAAFSSAEGVAPFGPTQAPSLTSLDPPQHDRMRVLVNKAFSPRRVIESRGQIESLTQNLLGAVGSPRFDLVAALAHPLPVFVIARMLGVPSERGPDFKRWSDALVGLLERLPTDAELAAVREMLAFFREVAAARRLDPREDLISALVHAEIDGQSLAQAEVLGMCLQLLVAGNETTTNLIANLVNVLVDRPELWSLLRKERRLVDVAIEETLRFDSPVQNLARTAAREVTLASGAIPAGARVLLSYGAANRDPAQFADPDSFRLDRASGLHLAFGFGVHYCLGAPLARLEASIAVNALLDRFAALERAAPGERILASVIRGFAKLPVTSTG